MPIAKGPPSLADRIEATPFGRWTTIKKVVFVDATLGVLNIVLLLSAAAAHLEFTLKIGRVRARDGRAQRGSIVGKRRVAGGGTPAEPRPPGSGRGICVAMARITAAEGGGALAFASVKTITSWSTSAASAGGAGGGVLSFAMRRRARAR